jgi:hypothetical protein
MSTEPNDKESKFFITNEDFTDDIEDWEELDDSINREQTKICEHIVEINNSMARIVERKRIQLKKFRNKNNKKGDKEIELNEIEVKYIFSREIMKNTYNFLSLSKDYEKKYFEK